MSNKEYNGWTNYETWRVNLELLGDIEWESTVTAEQLEQYVDDLLFPVYHTESPIQSIINGYASSFLQRVNYHEIANSINEEININQ